MQSNHYKDFTKKDDKQYTSIIDEYRRIKYFKYVKKFKIADPDILFALLVRCLKHMFKVKRDFVVGIEFGLNVKNTYTLYTLTELDASKKYISLEWNVDNDEYLLEFQLTGLKNKKHTKILFKQRIQRERTFFGMADYIGIVMYKKAFKSNMKAFYGYINHLVELGEVNTIRAELGLPEATTDCKTKDTKIVNKAPEDTIDSVTKDTEQKDKNPKVTDHAKIELNDNNVVDDNKTETTPSNPTTN